jgi:hypothetical protein
MFVFACPIIDRSQCWLFALRANIGKYPYLPSYVHIFPSNSTSGICAQWHRKELLKVHALGVFPPMYRGTGILKSFIYR